MEKRGKRATKIKGAPGNRTRQDIRRILRKAGSLERYCQWGREEQKEIEREKAQEDFDNGFLPGLAFMEENFLKHQRSPEAKRAYRQRILELRQQEKDPAKRIKGRINYPITREEIVELTVRPFWRKELGPTKDDVVRRLIRKLRRYKPPK